VCVFGSTGNESGHVFDPDVMLEIITLVVGTLQQEEIDTVRTIMSRDITLVIALAQNVNADIGVQGLKTGYVSNGQRKCQTVDVESIFVGPIVENSVWMACSRVQSRKYGVDKTFVIRVFLRLQQPFYCLATLGFPGTCCHIVDEIWLGLV